jgi:hypothetical protein
MIRARALVFAALCAATMGCSDDQAAAVDVGPSGPPSVRFTNPASGGDPVCVDVPADDDVRIPLQVRVEELLLRPPGGCGVFAQCGHLALSADGLLNNESSVRTIELLMRKIANRTHDGKPDASGQPDLLTVQVDVVSANGAVLLNDDGEPLRDTLELITVPSCAALPAGSGGGGGSGGSSGSGGSGGSPSTGGAGGMPGTGGSGGMGGSGGSGGSGGN